MSTSWHFYLLHLVCCCSNREILMVRMNSLNSSLNWLSLLVRMLCLVPERLTQSHCTYIAIVWGLRFAFFLNILIMFYALKSLCQPSTVSHTSSLQSRPMLNCVRVFSQYILRQMDLNLNIDFLLTEHIRSLDIESTVSFWYISLIHISRNIKFEGPTKISISHLAIHQTAFKSNQFYSPQWSIVPLTFFLMCSGNRYHLCNCTYTGNSYGRMQGRGSRCQRYGLAEWYKQGHKCYHCSPQK